MDCLKHTVCKLIHRIGYRGGSLLMFALVDFAFGFSYLFPAPAQKRSPGIQFLQSVAPLWLWGALWTAAGVVCLVNAFKIHDRIGFAAAIGIKVLWGLVYFVGVIVGVDRAWLSVALWLCLAGFVALISNWPEPTRFPHTLSPPQE